MNFKRGEIYLVEIFGRGHEQQGFRPVIIFSKVMSGIVAVIPLTGVEKALKYDGALEVLKSKLNGLDKNSIALANQIKTIDVRFLKNKLGELDKKDLDLIENKLKEFLLIK